jgi:His/Glu/Gln/Arg/opine family amino acid ABC transporter permease subunit
MSDFISVLTDNLDEFLAGFWVTVRLVVFAFAIAMVVGTLVAALRIAPSKWLQRLGGVYVETFRNVPLLVLLFISYAGVRRAGVDVDAWVAGTASLGLYTAAYVAEVLRSGVSRSARARSRRRSRSASPMRRRCAGSCCRRRSAR